LNPQRAVTYNGGPRVSGKMDPSIFNVTNAPCQLIRAFATGT